MKFAILNFNLGTADIINIIEGTIVFIIIFIISMINHKIYLRLKITNDEKMQIQIKQINRELETIKRNNNGLLEEFKNNKHQLLLQKQELVASRADSILDHILSEEDDLLSKYDDSYESFKNKIYTECLNE